MSIKNKKMSYLLFVLFIFFCVCKKNVINIANLKEHIKIIKQSMSWPL